MFRSRPHMTTILFDTSLNASLYTFVVNNPVNVYLFKVLIKTLEKGVKYVQS